MKNKVLLISLMMAFLPLSNVQLSAMVVNIPMQVDYVDPHLGQDGPHRGPELVPEVSIEDYTLTFTTPCYGWTLEMIDEDDDVAYTNIIASDTLVLPPTLCGDYQLRLIPNDGSNIYFYGYVLF